MFCTLAFERDLSAHGRGCKKRSVRYLDWYVWTRSVSSEIRAHTCFNFDLLRMRICTCDSLHRTIREQACRCSGLCSYLCGQCGQHWLRLTNFQGYVLPISSHRRRRIFQPYRLPVQVWRRVVMVQFAAIFGLRTHLITTEWWTDAEALWWVSLGYYSLKLIKWCTFCIFIWSANYY